MIILEQAIEKAVKELGYMPLKFVVEHPKEESHGDYSTNVSLLVAKEQGQKPREVAEKLVQLLQNDILVNRMIDRIEVAGPGFINFWLKKEWLYSELENASKVGYGHGEKLKGKKVMVEYTDPNPFKEFHIGHLMSNAVGESLTRLLEAEGAEVKRACYQGDVGLHVAKSVWGLMKKMEQEDQKLADLEEKTIKERQQLMGQAYAYGATQYENDESAKSEMNKLNKMIYAESDTTVTELYRKGREWSLDYFELIYDRLGTEFDEYFFESEAGKVGLEVVEEGLKKNVLEIGEEGAVVYRGEKDGMHTRVFRNKLGLPTYEAKDLGLAKTKYTRYKYDLSFIVTANEIDEYFKVVLKVMDQLYPDLRAKTTHLSHGVMKLTTGKMSSRTGKIVTGEGLLDELKEVVLAKMGKRQIAQREEVADQVAVAALKYTVLKQALGGDIVYDPVKMTNLEGNTGPFVQYAYARARSILNKFKIDQQSAIDNKQSGLATEELSLLRWIYRYPEVVEAASANFAPHQVATYLYELASRFNTFYQACRVEEGGKVNTLRYQLTGAVANILKSGLNLLGIQAPEEM